MKFINLSGGKYNRLTVIKFHGVVNKRTLWECVCECGNTTIVESHALKMGGTKSCGCLKREPTNFTHKLSNHPLYSIWCKIKERCYNQNRDTYHYYGGRGIDVCAEWKDDFKAFYDWCIPNGWQKGLEIDRINNNKGYYPNNCRFVTKRVNCFNRRSNVRYMYKGELRTLLELELVNGVSAKLIRNRIKLYGWDVATAVERPSQKSQSEMLVAG